MALSWILALPAHAVPFAEGWLTVPDHTHLSEVDLHGAIAVEGRRTAGPGTVEVRILLPPGSVDALRRDGRAIRVERADHRLGPPTEGYRDPDQGSVALAALAADARTHLVRLGVSVEGRPIDGVVFGRPAAEGAPTFRILAAHHGDEWSSFEVALAIAEALVDGTDSRVDRIADTSTVWIVPYVNPDGVAAGSRFNANGVDLNRNYDFAWSADERLGGDTPFSEPETRAVRGLGLHSRPMLGLSLHAGAINLGWVWNFTTDPAPEADLLEVLAEDYAAVTTAPGFWITNGAAWYLTRGDTNDWSYGRYGVVDYTLELTDPKAPAPEQIQGFVDWHLDAILAFLDQGSTLGGRITDPAGIPIEATLQIDGPHASQAFTSHPTAGTFHRIAALSPGSARSPASILQVSAPGFTPRAVPVPDDPDAARSLEIVLDPDRRTPGIAAPFVLDTPQAVVLPASVDGVVTLHRPGHDPVDVEAIGGTIFLDPAMLAPGSWSMSLADARVYLHALWVDRAETASVAGWSLSGDTLVVEGAGFGPGSHAWAFEGTDRHPIPLTVGSWTANRLEVGPIPDGPRIDVGIWTVGDHLGLEDIRNEEIEAPTVSEEDRRPPGCACGPQNGHLLPTVWSIVGVGLLSLRRRKT